jgi:hypothetical protein
MKGLKVVLVVALSLMFLAACGVEAETQSEGFGSAGALADENLTVESMMAYAIQDEYTARSEYEAIMVTFGEQRPFSNIILAEETHIEELLALYEVYGYDVPEDDSSLYVVVPDSLLEAYETGVQAEINNIAMYASFLEQDLPDDVRAVFESLSAASENHLAAFENQVEKEAERNDRQGNK